MGTENALLAAAGTPGSMVLPALVVGRAADGTRWVTVRFSASESEDPLVRKRIREALLVGSLTGRPPLRRGT